jgi:hypothetical protein
MEFPKPENTKQELWPKLANSLSFSRYFSGTLTHFLPLPWQITDPSRMKEFILTAEPVQDTTFELISLKFLSF